MNDTQEKTTTEQELDAALEQLIVATSRYADAIRQHGTLPQSHIGKLQQIAHLVDNWRTDYDHHRN